MRVVLSSNPCSERRRSSTGQGSHKPCHESWACKKWCNREPSAEQFVQHWLGCARQVVQHWLGCDLVKQLSDGHVKKWDNRVPTTRQVVQHRLGFEVVKQLRAGHAKRGVATCPPLARLCNTGLAVRHRETSACNGINHYQ